MQIRNKAEDLQKKAAHLLNDKKYSEAIEVYKQAINLYKESNQFRSDDLRLLSACHKSVSDDYIECLILDCATHQQCVNSDTDLAYDYLKSIEYIEAIPIQQKTDQDFHNLGTSYIKVGKLASLKEFDKAGKLFVSAAESFINAKEIQPAIAALQEFDKIRPLMTPKITDLKVTFLNNINEIPEVQNQGITQEEKKYQPCLLQ